MSLKSVLFFNLNVLAWINIPSHTERERGRGGEFKDLVGKTIGQIELGWNC